MREDTYSDIHQKSKQSDILNTPQEAGHTVENIQYIKVELEITNLIPRSDDTNTLATNWNVNIAT